MSADFTSEFGLLVLLAVIAYGLFGTGRSTTASQTTPGSASSHTGILS